jgi:hypothetical protein
MQVEKHKENEARQIGRMVRFCRSHALSLEAPSATQHMRTEVLCGMAAINKARREVMMRNKGESMYSRGYATRGA